MAVIKQSTEFSAKKHVAQPTSADLVGFAEVYTLTAADPLANNNIIEMKVLPPNTMAHSLHAIIEGIDSAAALSLDWGIITGTPGDTTPANRTIDQTFAAASTAGRSSAVTKVDLLATANATFHGEADTARAIGCKVVAAPGTPVVGKRIVLTGTLRAAYRGA